MCSTLELEDTGVKGKEGVKCNPGNAGKGDPEPLRRESSLAPADAKNCSLALEMLALDHFFIYLAQFNLIKSKNLIDLRQVYEEMMLITWYKLLLPCRKPRIQRLYQRK